MVITIITNREGSINFPWEEGLLEWLHENYPYSGYYIKEIEYA
jgi:hypothetical protein